VECERFSSLSPSAPISGRWWPFPETKASECEREKDSSAGVAVAEELWLTVRVTFQVLAFFLLLRSLVIV
jgi:hypothetical protein